MKPGPFLLVVAIALAARPAAAEEAVPAPAGPADSRPGQDAPAEVPGAAGAASSPAVPAPATPPKAKDAEERDRTRTRTWIDVGHTFVEERIFARVLRFDRFFSDERELEAERAQSFLRARSELRLNDRRRLQPSVGVSATLRLPGLNRWLDRARLVIGSQSEEAVSALFPGSQGPLGGRSDTLGKADAEVRYWLYDGLISHMDLGAGVLLELPPGLFGRVRYRAAVPLGGAFLARYSQSGYWRTDKLLGTIATAALERPMGWEMLLRLSGSAERAQRETRGIEWGSELALMRSFGPRVALKLAGAVSGAQHAPDLVDKYRVYLRWRRDLWRRWLFYELEPEVGWPFESARGRFREFAMTLRVEVQFQGNEPPPPPPPPEPPEPPDPPASPALPDPGRPR